MNPHPVRLAYGDDPHSKPLPQKGARGTVGLHRDGKRRDTPSSDLGIPPHNMGATEPRSARAATEWVSPRTRFAAARRNLLGLEEDFAALELEFDEFPADRDDAGAVDVVAFLDGDAVDHGLAGFAVAEDSLQLEIGSGGGRRRSGIGLGHRSGRGGVGGEGDGDW